MTNERKHSPFGPSSAHRWFRCPGSVRACERVKELPSPYSQDGTEAHDLAAYALQNNIRSATEALMTYPNTWAHRADDFVTRVDAVDVFLDTVYDVIDTYPGCIVLVETSVTFPYLDCEDVWGTGDVIILVPDFGFIFVFDYKHGSGHMVNAENNEQVSIYIGGALNEAQQRNIDIGLAKGTIVQPRVYRPDPDNSFWTTPGYILGEFRVKLQAAVAAAKDPFAPLVPGPTQCKFCPASLTCPAREAAALAVVNENFADVRVVNAETLPRVSELPLDRIARIMEAAPMLKGWLKDAEQAAFEYMKMGYTIPNHKMVYAQAKRRWYGLEEEIARQLVDLTGLTYDEIFPRKLIGITAAETAVKNAYKAKVKRGQKTKAAEQAVLDMAPLTMKDTSGNLTIAHITDGRPAVDLAQVNFADVKLIEERAY